MGYEPRPERKPVFLSGLPFSWNGDDGRCVCYRDAERLINADTEAKRSRIFDDLSPVFSDSAADEAMKDVEAARFVLIRALEAKCLIGSNFVCAKSLENLGVSLSDASGAGEGRTGARPKRPAPIDGRAFRASLSFSLDAPAYASYLKAACRSSDHWGFSKKSRRLPLFEFQMGLYPDSDAGMNECLRDLVDGLFSLHLCDVRTVSVDGGREARIADTAISAIWWAALDRLRDGRLGKCKACRRPFIAGRERGSKRAFCSDACRQWASVNRGLRDTDTARFPGVFG